MTSTFDVLTESPLHPHDFGEGSCTIIIHLIEYQSLPDAPIALGWGDKKTQFHGSLGKTAAQAGVDLSTIGTSPDDDSVPRISWRGDGALFVVSAVSPATVCFSFTGNLAR